MFLHCYSKFYCFCILLCYVRKIDTCFCKKAAWN